MNSFYNEIELNTIGLKSYGKNILISRKASFYNPEFITIGNNVRIDDFCILSGKITIGNFVHISAFNALYGKFGIEIGNFAGISPRCTIFSASDDFSGDFMISPMVPNEFTNVTGGPVKISDYVQIGANSILMPNITIGEGSITGTFTYVTKNIEPWSICIGIPAKVIKKRSKNLLQFANQIIHE
jgi:galactoside O-acetyltransferase